MKGIDSIQRPSVLFWLSIHVSIVLYLIFSYPANEVHEVFQQASLFGYSLFGLAGFWDYFNDARNNIGDISNDDAGNILTEIVIMTIGIVGLFLLTVITGSIINPLFGFPILIELSTIQQLIIAILVVSLYVIYDLTKFDDDFIGVHHWRQEEAKKFAILFLVIDLPVLVSLLFLLSIVIMLNAIHSDIILESLIGGAFAFELIAHNSAYTFLEAWPLTEWIDDIDGD